MTTCDIVRDGGTATGATIAITAILFAVTSLAVGPIATRTLEAPRRIDCRVPGQPRSARRVRAVSWPRGLSRPVDEVEANVHQACCGE